MKDYPPAKLLSWMVLLLLISPVTFAGPTDWMAGIGGSTRLTQLTIPGTHDSGAIFETFPGTAKAQDFSIAEQLNFGVRYLDIRCRHIDDAFDIYHGAIYQFSCFGAVLNQVYAFLDANPTECVIMVVKEEHDPVGNTRSFEDTFDWYVSFNPAKWYLGSSVPTLDNARGKIVLLRRFVGSQGINARNWLDNTTFLRNNLLVQDEYVVVDNAVKWAAVTRTLEFAFAETNPNILYLNHASGYTPDPVLTIPDIPAVADYINPRLLLYFTTAPPGHYGCVIMDFADAVRSALILSANPPDDPYESNDSIGTAYDLSNHENQWLTDLEEAGIQRNADWYRITVSSGEELLQALCTFQHSEGNIDLSLYDSQGTLLDTAQSSTDNEEITHRVPGAGNYYLKVFSENRGNSYDLWWDDLVPPPPSTYAAWAAAITNGLTGYNESWAGDGVPNLLKYATGSSAVVRDQLATVSAVDGNPFQLKFNRNGYALDVTIHVEAGDDLTGASWEIVATNEFGVWTAVPGVVVSESASGAPLAVCVEDSRPRSLGRFYRLRVTIP